MAVTSYLVPTTVTEDTSVGTQTVTNPGNSTATGGTFAEVNWPTGTQTSSRVKMQNIATAAASAIPSGSTIDGFEIQYSASEDGSTDNLETKEIFLIKADGTLITGTNMADTGEWTVNANPQARGPVGGATNVMGYTGVTRADVIDTDFGFSFRCGTIGSGTTPSGQFNNFGIRIYYTAPSGYTMSGAMSQDDDSMSGSAQVLINMTGAMTMDEDSMAGASQVRVNATMAATMEEDSMSGSMTVVSYTASAAMVMDDDTMAGSAQVRVSASAAMTMEEDSMSGSSQVLVGLSGAMTQDDDTMSGASQVLIAASAAMTADDDSMSGASQVQIAMSGALSTEDAVMFGSMNVASAAATLTGAMATDDFGMSATADVISNDLCTTDYDAAVNYDAALAYDGLHVCGTTRHLYLGWGDYDGLKRGHPQRREPRQGEPGYTNTQSYHNDQQMLALQNLQAFLDVQAKLDAERQLQEQQITQRHRRNQQAMAMILINSL